VSNLYEQLLLNDAATLERKIYKLVDGAVWNNFKTEKRLELIAKVIDFSYTIDDECLFDGEYSSVCGSKTFYSIEEYNSRKEYDNAEEAEQDGIEWNDAPTGSSGLFSWVMSPEVSVEIYGLTEDASEEAKDLWKTQVRKDDLRAAQILFESVKEHCPELSAAEANA